MATPASLWSVPVSRLEARELMAHAYKEMVRHSDLRLGQVIYNTMYSYGRVTESWPELFYEECPTRASEIFYSVVEGRGKRELTGSLDMSFLDQ